MRRPGKHSVSPLSSTTSASTTKTMNALSKTGYKTTWKNAVLKIGKQKLAESVADNPESRSEKAAVVAVIDDDSSRTQPSSKSSLLSKKKSILHMGKRTRTSFFDTPQTKIGRRVVSSVKNDSEIFPSSEINDGGRSDSNVCKASGQDGFAQNSSVPSISSPTAPHSYLFKEKKRTERSETAPFASSSLSPQTCSCSTETLLSTVDGSNKKVENLNEEAENLLEETGMLECSTTTNNSRELSEEEKHMILVDFDAGMLPHEIEEKYGIGKLQIADVLSNRISTFRTHWSDLFTLKRRRTVYVRLNMQMWNYFCQCRDQKIWLNGRQLKEQALKIAHELGLHSFKASEGWLDSFKRRHCIDLKAMTGKPVIYEADPEDVNTLNDGLEIKIARSTTPSPRLTRDANSLPTVVDANKFLMDAADAAVLASVDGCDSGIAVTSPTQATAAIGTTSPLDIQRLLPGPSVINEPSMLLPTINASEIGASSIQALLETCCYRVNEIEVAQAIDTLRAYIVSNNINLLPVLVELQKSLAIIAAQRSATEKMSSGI